MKLGIFRLVIAAVLTTSISYVPALGQQDKPAAPGHYMFAWSGDKAKTGADFLAVIDADPSSPSYGRLVTTLATDQRSVRVHHTEFVMPPSGMLFADDHDARRTFIFDVRDPLHPKVAASFTDMAGYMHPHSYLRLPNGHVLATFQHSHDSMNPETLGKHGGLVEIDDTGKVIRSASSADAAFPDALLTPYSLVVLPELDRVVSTNSAMNDEDVFRGLTYQVWRLSDLKLLKTMYFDGGDITTARSARKSRGWGLTAPSMCKRWHAAWNASPASAPTNQNRNWSTRFPPPIAEYPPSSGTIWWRESCTCTP